MLVPGLPRATKVELGWAEIRLRSRVLKKEKIAKAKAR